MSPIPFNKPAILGKELYYMSQVIHNGHAAGDGPFTARCEAYLERALSVPKALLTTSCTDALEMAAVLLDIRHGDEVIVPSFTFVSTANAFALRGARPVFVDIRPDTLNMDESQIQDAITPLTKAIVPVHYAGVGCEMEAICGLASRHGIPVVEDNAHGLFGRYKGRLLGTFGQLAAQSFHETKNITCGEGGALVINDPGYIERAEIIRQKGTNRNQFYRGEVDKYTWVDIGSSYLPSDLLAAFLYAQLESVALIQRRRRRMWEYYHEELHVWAKENNVTLPTVPLHCEHPSHLFYLILPTSAQRGAFIRALKEQGIESAFHYTPLHNSPMGLKAAGRRFHCPVTEKVSERLVRLPFFNDLTEAELARIVRTIVSVRLKPKSVYLSSCSAAPTARTAATGKRAAKTRSTSVNAPGPLPAAGASNRA